MANIQINDLGTVTDLVLTDELEIQHTGGGLSKKVTGTQINNLVRANLTTNAKTLYVASWGSDVTGTGTQANPYATLQYAYSQITPTSVNSYQIEVENGVYNWTTVAIKPFVFVNFNNSVINITNPVTLDPSWGAAVSVASWDNSYSSNFSLTLNFNIISVLAGTTFILRNHSFSTSVNHNILGNDDPQFTFLFLENFGIKTPNVNITIQDCYGSYNGAYINSFIHNSNNSNSNFVVKDVKTIGNFTKSMAFIGGTSVFEMDSCFILGHLTIGASNGTLNSYKTNTTVIGNEGYLRSGGGTHNAYTDYRNSDSSKSAGMKVRSLSPINIWGKFEVYGNSIDPTVVLAGSTPSQLNFNGSTDNNVYEEMDLDINTVTGTITNNTGRDGFFNIRSRLTFRGVGIDADLNFVHVINGNTPLLSSQAQATASVTLGIESEVNVESDIFLIAGDYIQLGVYAVDLNTKNMQVIGHTIRVSGSGHG